MISRKYTHLMRRPRPVMKPPETAPVAQSLVESPITFVNKTNADNCVAAAIGWEFARLSLMAFAFDSRTKRNLCPP